MPESTRKSIAELKRYKEIEKKQIKGRTILKEVAQRRSVSGRTGNAIAKFFSTARRGVARTLYDRQKQKPTYFLNPRTGEIIYSTQDLTHLGYIRTATKVSGRKAITGMKSSGRGRPRGTFDPRYAKYGGVYGYRKWLATQLKLQKIQAQREAVVTPRQQAIINQVRNREQVLNTAPESRTIPSTSGRIPLRGIMEEIDYSANLVP